MRVKLLSYFTVVPIAIISLGEVVSVIHDTWL